MKKLLTLSALLVLAACSDTVAPCTEFCRPGEVVVRVELLEDVFAPREVRNGIALWGPGDSLAIRYTIENATTTRLDSVYFEAATFNSLESTNRGFTQIAAQSSAVVTDTVRIDEFIYEGTQPLFISLLTDRGDSTVQHVVEGDTVLHFLTRGLTIEVLTMPDARIVQRPNREPITAATLRGLVESGFLLRLRNPYDLATPSTRVNSCWFDIDFCAEQFPASDVIPAIAPGGSYDLELSVRIQTPDRLFAPWQQGLTEIKICRPGGGFFDGCTYVPVLVMPNIEALCAVTAVEPGVAIVPRAPDCGSANEGSAYRFTARKGERYRVETSGAEGAGFIIDADGTSQYEGPAELLIPRDGTYYVIIRNSGATSFRLLRV